MKLNFFIQNVRATNTKEKRMLSSPKIKGIQFELFVLTAFLSANNFIIFVYMVPCVGPCKNSEEEYKFNSQFLNSFSQFLS